MLSLLDEAQQQGARLEAACEVLGLPARTVQRWRDTPGGDDLRQGPKSGPGNQLSAAERREVVELANRPEFRDLSPKQIVPRLADEGRYVASESTFYRILRAEGQMVRRDRTRPPSPRPRQHEATGPCQVWSWDITYLRGPCRGAFFYLYLVEDIWSRKIVGWDVETEESMEYGAALAERTIVAEGADAGRLVLHADNGGPMKGSTMLATLQRLGVVPSFSRPRVSDDNPYSEALFRTLKYRPGYPRGPFPSLEAARAWVEGFVAWYNDEHLHSGIAFVTPASRHVGEDETLLARRRRVYERARRHRPERWSRHARPWARVQSVVLNPERGRNRSAEDPCA